MAAVSLAQSSTTQFVFTSDAHYGLTRATFRGAEQVDAHAVNAAMVARINQLPDATFPRDGGIKSGERIGAIDFLAQGGDVANRAEVASRVQSPAQSWAQFRADYLEGLHLRNQAGAPAQVFVVPGNHDASNAVGFYREMAPYIDKTSMAEIYNRLMMPAVPKTAQTYNYETDHVLTSRDIGGVHFIFLTVWPDSVARAWMDADLSRVPATTPVAIVTHDQPESESKHFRNPNGAHDINATDMFENLLADQLADGPAVSSPDTIEQSAFEVFLRRHSNVTAYFHGNSNWNQFYDWTGPGHSVILHTFRVDSPMKGAISAGDETRLSFQVVTIDMASRTMTVRECLWNADPRRPDAPLVWGSSTTVAFPR
jgi:hypothetical protein